MQDTRLYAVATAHLDTVWRWSLKKTIEDYLLDTVAKNLNLLENYPEYTFNFEGAFRYALIEEYYPDLFKKIQGYVKEGRWHPTGAEYENGDVNIPSPEALIRNILYGNRYFEEKFGVKSRDIFLPDCFGFGKALPSVMAHTGLKGFTTQKLSWGCSVPLPFDLGIWKGTDASCVYTTLDAKSYRSKFENIQTDEQVYDKIAANYNQSGIPFALYLYGTGDVGGAPDEKSVWTVCDEVKNASHHPIQVISATPDRFYNDIDALPEQEKAKLPVYDGELLMTSHGAGSYTSRTMSKRLNRQCETAADVTEASLVLAQQLCGHTYPQKTMEKAWKKVIQHQFHDDITGTSNMDVYNAAHSDYFTALNLMHTELCASAKAVGEALDTSFCPEAALIVFNPTQYTRFDSIEATVRLKHNAKYVKITNSRGEEQLSQVVFKSGKTFRVVFSAELAPLSYTVFSAEPSDTPCRLKSDLKMDAHRLENENYLVRFNKNGDIGSIFDKRLQKELLQKPIKLALMHDTGSLAYPAWEMRKEDIDRAPYAYANTPTFEILEKGPSRIALRVTRGADLSTKITQVISLSSRSPVLRVENEVDWQSRRSMLKAEFRFTAENKTATYDLGLGTIQRRTNTDTLYEVPAQKWADLTDSSGAFGVSIFSDSKYGWDKPDSSTLRLTCIHTPAGAFIKEARQDLQDIGRNLFGFGIYAHAHGFESQTQMYAELFSKKPLAFQTSSQTKGCGRDCFSLLTISDNDVLLRAVKRSEDGKGIVIRLNEGVDRTHKRVKLQLACPVKAAYETNAAEEDAQEMQVSGNALCFDIAPYDLKTFYIVPGKPEKAARKEKAFCLELPYNADGVTSNAQRKRAILAASGCTLPYELFPKEICCGGIPFTLADRDSLRTALIPTGQVLDLPAEATAVYLLAAGVAGDRTLTFKIGNMEKTCTIHDAFAPIGQWDMEGLQQKAKVKDVVVGLEFTHTHHPLDDHFDGQARFYVYRLETHGAAAMTLPENGRTVILAATAVKENSRLLPGSFYADRPDEDYQPPEIAPGEKLIGALDAVTIRAGKIQDQTNGGKGQGFKRNNPITNIIRSYTKSEW